MLLPLSQKCPIYFSTSVAQDPHVPGVPVSDPEVVGAAPGGPGEEGDGVGRGHPHGVDHRDHGMDHRGDHGDPRVDHSWVEGREEGVWDCHRSLGGDRLGFQGLLGHRHCHGFGGLKEAV